MRYTSLFLLWLMVPLAECALPERAELQKQSDRCEKILHRSVIDFYLPHCLDRQHGGYLENLNASGKFSATGEKFLTLQTRQIWFFSTLATEGIRREEALVSMLELFKLTGDEEYYRVFARTLDFIERHQVAAEGGWWATRQADGSPHQNKSRTSMWQGAYHSGRALILSSKLLKELGR